MLKKARNWSLLLRLLIALSTLTPMHSPIAMAANETFTSPEKAGADFELQGEYTGIIDAWGGAVGAQVIALGNSSSISYSFLVASP